MKNLFIIGNGFDLHQGVNSSYDDYRDYLRDKGYGWVVCFYERSFFAFDLPEEYSKIHKGIEACGSDLRKRGLLLAKNFAQLPSLNTWRFVEVMLGCINGIRGGEETQTLEFARIMIDELSNWMKDEIEKKVPTDSKLKLPIEDSSYLTFNYTETLEKSCGIPSDKVLHIHNKIGEKLLFGHTNYKAIEDCKQPICVPELDDSLPPEFKALVGEKLKETADDYNNNGYLGRYYETTLKDVKQVLQKNSDFFDSLTGVENVFVLGHSLSSVDKIYFDAINKKSPNANWIVSYYNEEAKEDIEETAFYQQIKTRVTFKSWEEIDAMFA